ncbi:hypothetical protein ABL849_17430 [Variovorax sp. 375MFSha3.1]|uniref:hypothetical protein n=1 Tax=Variovorax sp. 375MFSha3.1 TaxID=3158364 RepID=UPI003AAE503F
MKPDLSQSDFQGLLERSEFLSRRTRTLYGIAPAEPPASTTPLDWLYSLLRRVFALVCAAVLFVTMLAVAFSKGPTP